MPNRKFNKEEIASLSSALNDILGNSKKLDENLEKIFAGTGKISRQLEKDLKKAAVGQLKNISKLNKEVSDLRKKWGELTEEQKKDLSVKEKQIRASMGLVTAVDNISRAQEKQKTGTVSLGKEIDGLISRVGKYTSVIGILSATIDGVVELYRNWARLQGQITSGMGLATRALGGTERQMDSFRASVENFRGAFSDLQGDVDGYAESFRFMQEITLSLRRDVSTFTDEAREGMLEAAIGFNVGAEGAAELFRLLETGVAGGRKSITDFGGDMIRFANSISANASQLTSDFLAAKDSVAQFGSAGAETFRRAAMMANEFGFETRRIFDMMKGFDTFGQASQNVNQLNAMLGTSLSSFELMMEQDPAKRLETIRRELFAQGQTWNTMSRQARQALSQITGQEESILARVFGEGRSLSEIEAEQERMARQAEEREMQRISNQEMMNDLLTRASIIFDTWDRNMQRIWNTLSQAFGPVFQIIHDNIVSIAREFNGWIENSEEGKQFIRDISDSVQEVINGLRNVDWRGLWEDTKQTWREWQPAVETVGRMLMDVLGFVRDNPELFVTLFAVGAITRFAGGLSSIASLLSPGGLVVAGAALFAMHFSNAARNLNDVQDRMEEIRRNQERGVASAAENQEIENVRQESQRFLGAATEQSLRGEVMRAVTSVIGNRAVNAGFEIMGSNFEMMGDTTGIDFLSEYGRGMQRTAGMARAFNEGDFRALAQTQISAGVSASSIQGQLLNAARNDPNMDLAIRRSFGIAGDADLSSGLMSQLQQMQTDSGGSASSAVSTAPATNRTAQAPEEGLFSRAVNFAREVTQTIILQLDGKEVARTQVEGARR